MSLSIIIEKETKNSIKSNDLDILQINQFANKDIIRNKKIGSGGFGKIISGNYKSLPIAIKIFKNFNFSEFLREIKILKMIRHPNVASLYGVIPIHSKDHTVNQLANLESVNLVNELILGDTFDILLKNNNTIEIQKIVHLIDLATVLTYIHSLKLIHRDLKPSNVMIDKNLNLKLLDFGISKISQNSYTSTLTTGTMLYMAPENFTLESATTDADVVKGVISNKVDVWAFGCMISELFSGHRPWSPYLKDDRVIMGFLFSKKNFMIPQNLKDSKDETWVNLIKDCTVINPQERINMKTVREKLIKILYTQCKNYFKDNISGEVLIKEMKQSLDCKKMSLILNKIKKYLDEYLKLSINYNDEILEKERNVLSKGNLFEENKEIKNISVDSKSVVLTKETKKDILSEVSTNTQASIRRVQTEEINYSKNKLNFNKKNEELEDKFESVKTVIKKPQVKSKIIRSKKEEVLENEKLYIASENLKEMTENMVRQTKSKKFSKK